MSKISLCCSAQVLCVRSQRLADNAHFRLQHHAEAIINRILHQTDQLQDVRCRRAAAIDDETAVQGRYLRAADCHTLEVGILDQLAREMSLRPLKRAACGRVLHRLRFWFSSRIVSAIAAGSPCASCSDANSAI